MKKPPARRRGPAPETMLSGQLVCRIPLSIMDRLREAATREGTSVGSVVRQTLAVYFSDRIKPTTTKS